MLQFGLGDTQASSARALRPPKGAPIARRRGGPTDRGLHSSSWRRGKGSLSEPTKPFS